MSTARETAERIVRDLDENWGTFDDVTEMPFDEWPSPERGLCLAIESALLSARDEALQEAAGLADKYDRADGSVNGRRVAISIASAIRTLKGGGRAAE